MRDTYSNVDEFKEACGYIIDDVWYPRVTKIVGIKAKPALYRYYGEASSYRAAEAVTEQSAKEGTLVHEAVEGLLMGQKPDINATIKPAVDAFLEFMDKRKIHVSPELVEKRIVSFDHRYAGTVDALALIDGKFGVLDIKTSQSIYRDYNLQTAAYIEALKNNFENLGTRWILRIDQTQTCGRCGATRRVKGGREKVRQNGHVPCPVEWGHEWSEIKGDIELQEFPFWQADFEAFLGAKRLWEWENEGWLKRVGYN